METLPDPYCILNVFEAGDWVQHQKTEAVRNQASPQFAKKFTLQYRFEKRQKLRFDMFAQPLFSPLSLRKEMGGIWQLGFGQAQSAPGNPEEFPGPRLRHPRRNHHGPREQTRQAHLVSFATQQDAEAKVTWPRDENRPREELGWITISAVELETPKEVRRRGRDKS